jgi:hypothetical protein
VTRREAIVAAAAATGAPLAARPAAARGIRLDELRRLEHAAVAESVSAEQTAMVALEAIANGGELDDRTAATVRILLDHATDHADAIAEAYRNALGEDPPLAPKRTAIPGLAGLRGRDEALRLAERLELRAIAVHLATVRRTHKAEIVKAIAGSVGSDAQGLVLLRQLLGEPPAPAAFERGRR